MFGNLMGDMEEKQKALQEKLAGIIVEGTAGDGAVIVSANCVRQITNISINADLIDDTEEVEDLVLVAVNRALDEAMRIEAAESKSLLSDLMPPGMENMLGGMM